MNTATVPADQLIVSERQVSDSDNNKEPMIINEQMEASVSRHVDIVSALGSSNVASNREFAFNAMGGGGVAPNENAKSGEIYFTQDAPQLNNG